MTRSAAGSKAQKQNPKSQKGKPSAENGGSGGIVPQPSREPLPMKRHKGLFIALMGVFIAWVGVMLGLYITTVRPREHSAPAPPPPPSPSPSQPQPAAATTRAVASMWLPPP